MTQQDFYVETLVNKQIRPSVQRIAIYRYIYDHKNHPTVDTVYDELSPNFPTLSKTTVYNTIHLFKENNLVQEIRIEDDEIRYDAELRPHLHFKCTKCNNIFDIMENNSENTLNESIIKLLPQGFKQTHIETNIWGICKNCN